MIRENLFVYGTLKDPRVQFMVLGRMVRGKWDSLADYQKSTIQLGGRFFPIIKPQVGNTVEGMVITVTLAELQQIDRYEGHAYRRRKVTLASGRQAWVYQA
jgi:gamma-glutamylcyclotransferase (GGCT)/AIG2-like uncharacterized protein YtfP